MDTRTILSPDPLIYCVGSRGILPAAGKISRAAKPTFLPSVTDGRRRLREGDKWIKINETLLARFGGDISSKAFLFESTVDAGLIGSEAANMVCLRERERERERERAGRATKREDSEREKRERTKERE